jgi:hypothetical protein
MTSRLVGAAALALLLASPAVTSAQDLASQLVGVWKRTSQVNKSVATGETSKPMGENPTGTAIFTRGGYFTYIFIGEGRKPPASLPPTDAEVVALYNTAGFASGGYKVDGDKVTFLYHTVSNQVWTGTERVQTMQVSGKVLTWTSAPFKTAAGMEVIATFTFERLE